MLRRFMQALLGAVLLLGTNAVHSQDPYATENASQNVRVDYTSTAEYASQMANLQAELRAYQARLESLESGAAASSTYTSNSQPAQGSCNTSCYSSPGWYASGQFLSWKARRSTTAYAGNLSPVTGPGINAGDSYSNSLIETNYDRDPGFRLRMGYVTENRWDIGLQYTYFNSNGASAVGDPTMDSDSVFTNLGDRSLYDDAGLNGDFEDGIVDFAQETISVRYNVFDVVMGRWVNLNHGFALRFIGGLRFAEINQASNVTYANLEAAADLDQYNLDRRVTMKAWGFTTGGEVHWGLGDSGLSIFTRGQLSMLRADFDLSRLDVANNLSSDIAIRGDRLETTKIVPVMELALGGRYEYNGFYVGVGYEFANWFNMLQDLDRVGYDDINDETTPVRADRGDLTFDGWFVEAGVTY